MAKKKSQKSIHTHVPTNIGVGIIALVVLVVGLIVVTQYNTSNQTQTVQSQAAGNPPKTQNTVTTSKPVCISYTTTGKCVLYQSTTTTIPAKSPCISYNTSGKCTFYQGTNQTISVWTPTPPQPKKCQNGSCSSSSSSKSSGSNSGSTAPGVGTSCKTPQGSGKCELTSTKPGSGQTFLPGYCPGPANVQCLVKTTTSSNPNLSYCTSPFHVSNGHCCNPSQTWNAQKNECLNSNGQP